ncbi:MAG: protoporphyrinogen oxidase [Chlamydiae bacterium]|nr:protoporphyrinogen oxidase [Chlamydiota bacterium]
MLLYSLLKESVRLMEKKNILILGAGISGLSAAYYLSKNDPSCSITILEKQDRAGGWIKSSDLNGFFFEMGPRIFKGSKSQDLLQLIHELGLEKEIVLASGAKDRHILWNGNLEKLPQNFLSFLLSPLTRNLVFPLLTEWRKPPISISDESIRDFILRRFGKDVLERLIDPLTQGIYAADPSELSIRSCFGALKNYEDKYGSVTSGVWNEVIKKKKDPNVLLPKSSLFTLKGGVETLVMALKKQSSCAIEYGQEVEFLAHKNGKFTVKTQDKEWTADSVFIALPVSQVPNVLRHLLPDIAKELSQVPSASITSVLVGFKKDVLPLKGFGYLVPTGENLPILGAVFDSKTFTEKEETRITIMLKGCGYSPEEIETQVSLSLKNHLKILSNPDLLHVHVSENAVPKFLVGHKDKMAFVDRDLKRAYPGLHLLGNYLQGVSVSDCIKRSKNQVEERSF